MQVAQYIRQPIRQRRKVKRRLPVDFGAMIFAVTAPHHPILMHWVITAGPRRVAMRAIKLADARLPELINRDAAVPESSFNPLPAPFLRESREQTPEPMVIELPGANLLPR